MPQTTIRRPAHCGSSRLFFAIYPHKEIRERLAMIQAGFDTTTARPVSEDNLHLTLAFLGEVSIDKYACYTQAAGTLPPPDFRLTLDRLSYFSKASLCWLAPSQPPEELFTLQRQLKSAITPCGHHDPRSFKPHVTLFRKASGLTCKDAPAPVEWRVDRFFLMESIQKSDGTSYLPLEEYGNTHA